jgi:hypothetical protein
MDTAMNADPHRPVRWPALQKISVDQQLCESSGNRRGVFLRAASVPLRAIMSGVFWLLIAAALHGVAQRVLGGRGGRDSIDHAPGAHDDIANAVAGALLLTGTRQPMRVSPRALEMSRQTGLRHVH